jgi:hypothetical protein
MAQGSAPVGSAPVNRVVITLAAEMVGTVLIQKT